MEAEEEVVSGKKGQLARDLLVKWRGLKEKQELIEKKLKKAFLADDRGTSDSSLFSICPHPRALWNVLSYHIRCRCCGALRDKCGLTSRWKLNETNEAKVRRRS